MTQSAVRTITVRVQYCVLQFLMLFSAILRVTITPSQSQSHVYEDELHPQQHRRLAADELTEQQLNPALYETIQTGIYSPTFCKRACTYKICRTNNMKLTSSHMQCRQRSEQEIGYNLCTFTAGSAYQQHMKMETEQAIQKARQRRNWERFLRKSEQYIASYGKESFQAIDNGTVAALRSKVLRVNAQKDIESAAHSRQRYPFKFTHGIMYCTNMLCNFVCVCDMHAVAGND